MQWVELSRLFGKLKVLCYEAEPVVGQEREAALARLVARIGRSGAFVVCHVDVDDVNVHVVEAPAFDDDGDLDEWLESQGDRYIPSGNTLPSDDTSDSHSVRTRVLHNDPERGPRCLIVVGRHAGIEARLALLETVGLNCERLATGIVEPLSALVFAPGFAGRPRRVTLAEDTHRVHYRVDDGRLGAVHVEHEAAYGDEDGGGRLQGALGGEPHLDAGWVIGSRAEAVTLGVEGLEVVAPLGGVLETELPPKASIAAALALEAVYPELALTDLLDEGRSLAVRERSEKEEGQRTVLLMGGLLVLLLLSSMLGVMGLSTLVEHVVGQVAVQADVLQGLSAAEQENARLTTDLRTAKRLTEQKSEVARLLEDVGRAVPGGVSVVSLTLNEQDDQMVVRITGISIDGAGAAEHMTALERLEILDEVELVYAERLSVDEVRQRYGIGEVATSFKIESVYP